MRQMRQMAQGSIGNYSTVHFNMLQNLHNKLHTVARKADLETVFNIPWKDGNFNVVPFFCAGLSFLNGSDGYSLHCLAETIHNYVLKDENIDMVLSDVTHGLDKYLKENLSEDEYYIFQRLLVSPNYTNSYSVLALYLYTKDKREFLKMGLDISSDLLSGLVNGYTEFNFYQLKDKSIGNVEAFCFYIGLKWLCSVEPQFKLLLGKFFKNLELDKKYEEFSPEGSLLDDILQKKISGVQINLKYYDTRFDDDSTLFLREALTTAVDGDYDGHELNSETLDILTYWAQKNLYTKFVNAENYLYCIVTKKLRKDGLQEVSKLKNDIISLESDNNTYQRNVNRYRDEVEELKDKIKSLTDDLNRTRKELSGVSKFEDLEEEITSLKKELEGVKNDKESLFKDYMQSKQEISLLRKKVGKTVSRTIEEKLHNEEEDVLLAPTVSLEDKIAVFKDKQILLLGAEFLEPTVDKLKSYGLANITLISKDNKKPGYFDACVVLATRCLHDIVRHIARYAEKYGAGWLYSSYVNAEKIVDVLYDYFKEDVEEETNVD